MSIDKLLQLIETAFPTDAALHPTTLRQGDDMDSYREPAEDTCSIVHCWRDVADDYLIRYQSGLIYLDAQSWRYYLPAFLGHAIRNSRHASPATDACLANLRPPDKEPPRFKTLSPAQRDAVIKVLEYLAFDPASVYQATACQVLEEYWIEKPLYGDG